MSDNVNPDHYKTATGVECKDAMLAAFGPDEYAAFCKLNAFKYLWRLGKKDNPSQELGKIQWYLKRLEEYYAETNRKD